MLYPKKKLNNSLKGISLIAVLAGALLLSGCISWPSKSYTPKFKPVSKLFQQDASGLVKKVYVTTFKDKTGYSEKAFDAVFQKAFMAELMTFADVVEVKKPLSIPVMEGGRVDNFELAREGRKRGLNVILTNGSVNVTVFEEMRGKLLFEKPHYFIQVLVLAESYSSTDGTKILEDSYRYDVELEPLDYELILENRSESIKLIETVMEQAGTLYGQYYKENLERTPWAAFVDSLDGDSVMISAGEASGLSVGMELAVYKPGNRIKGYGGHTFLSAGEKTGVLKIVSLSREAAVAEMVSGKVRPGSVITGMDD